MPLDVFTIAASGVAVAGVALWRRSRSVRPDTSVRNLGVVITGSTRGLGFAMAKEFLMLGDSVVINGRNAVAVEEARAALAPHCTKPGQRVVGFVADVSNAESCDALAKEAHAELGRLDLWLNNAGMTQTPKARLAETPAETVEAVVRTNLLGTLYGCRSAIAHMLAHGGGAVFNVDGTGSRGNATAQSAAYGASKAAVPQLMKTLASETRGTPVRVHTVSPGMVITDLLMSSAQPRGDAKEDAPPPNRHALQIFNILAEKPETTAAWLVPRMRGAAERPSGEYIKYLTPPSVAWRFLTSPWRRNRLIEVPAPAPKP